MEVPGEITGITLKRGWRGSIYLLTKKYITVEHSVEPSTIQYIIRYNYNMG